MGLDASAYDKIELTEPHEYWATEDCGDHVRAFVLKGFEHGLEGLEADRCYLVSNSVHHVSQAYGNYNRYREVLCHAVNGVDPQVVWEDPDTWRDKPFYEQINFADNEGVLGPVACRALADDYDQQRQAFLDGLDAAIEHYFGQQGVRDPKARGYYLSKYDDWKQMFDAAADSGIVQYC